MDDVIVAQHTVQRQVFCNAVIITRRCRRYLPRVHGLDGAADNCLLGFKGVFNVGFAGYFPGSTIRTFIGFSPYQKFLSAQFSA